MNWSRRHRTAAWVATALLVSLIWLGVRDDGMPHFSSVDGGVLAPALLVVAAVIGVYLLRRRGRRRRFLR